MAFTHGCPESGEKGFQRRRRKDLFDAQAAQQNTQLPSAAGMEAPRRHNPYVRRRFQIQTAKVLRKKTRFCAIRKLVLPIARKEGVTTSHQAIHTIVMTIYGDYEQHTTYAATSESECRAEGGWRSASPALLLLHSSALPLYFLTSPVSIERDLLLDLFLEPLQHRFAVGVFQNPRDHALRTLLGPNWRRARSNTRAAWPTMYEP